MEKDDAFLRKLNAGEKVIAIELDSPRVADLSGYLDGARRLQAAGADLLTIADCPIAQARMDSSLVACRVHRELGMCALPHMTCRDRNLNATKALLLGLYAEGVREVLAITGDPIPTAERDEVKNVYQFNSRKLAQYIVSLAGEGREMPSAMTVFGALDLNARNFDVELRRAVEKLEAKLAGLEAMQEEMKTVNAYYRKHKTLEGCPVLSAEEIGKLQSSMASDWRKNPVPYPSYLLTNNNANIRRTRQRIEDLKSQSEYSGWAFPGGRAEINEGENRLQLFFEEKPSEEQRRELKSNGFKWAPSQGAWQRQLTKNAIYAAGRMEFLRPEDGQSPYQLQPFARKTEKDMTR